MPRPLVKLLLLGLLTLAAWVAMWCYERQASNPVRRDADAKTAAATAESRELTESAQRLAAAPQRVAGLLVTDQSESEGVVHTTLLFQEYANDEPTPPPRRFTFEGRSARVEATVLKLQGPFVNGRESLRGATIPLFLRLCGEKETPETAHPIDEPGRIPAVYRGPNVTVNEFEQQLWRDFWRLANDEAYRARAGVSATPGRVDLGPLEAGRLYTLTLHSDASLAVSSEPLKDSYREMLKRDEQTAVPRTNPTSVPGR